MIKRRNSYNLRRRRVFYDERTGEEISPVDKLYRIIKQIDPNLEGSLEIYKRSIEFDEKFR